MRRYSRWLTTSAEQRWVLSHNPVQSHALSPTNLDSEAWQDGGLCFSTRNDAYGYYHFPYGAPLLPVLFFVLT